MRKKAPELDFEDCLQEECTKSYRADYIVSRNTVDFMNSDIPCIEPEEVCRIKEDDGI